MPNFALVGNFSFSFVSALGIGTAIAIVLAVMLSDFFDTMGTVVGIGGEAGMLDKDGRLPGHAPCPAGGLARGRRRRRGLRVVEHDVHRERGRGRRGRPDGPDRRGRRRAVPALPVHLAAGRRDPAGGDGPVLVIVGYYMMTLVKDIDWKDPGIGIPVLLTIAVMPFTYSITNGVGAGFLSYTLIQLFRGTGPVRSTRSCTWWPRSSPGISCTGSCRLRSSFAVPTGKGSAD